jgi:ABC-type branched-subunit amino acid transport system ATPase component
MSQDLSAQTVSRNFAGIVAVSGVSLTVKPGEIHGLIGPNGSGKTTMLNLLSGYYPINSGAIWLGNTDISRSSVQDRARLGVSRTFQAPKLLPEFSVLDNAMLGGWPHVRSSFIETAFSTPRPLREEKAIRERASNILDGIGLGAVKSRRAALLEHTAQRLLEIARALTMMPRFILLDEPAGGLTVKEIDKLADIVNVIRDSGIGVLIVEHHTDFVFRICDRVTVLNLGEVLAHGAGNAVSRDPEVVRVYLGA